MKYADESFIAKKNAFCDVQALLDALEHNEIVTPAPNDTVDGWPVFLEHQEELLEWVEQVKNS